MNKIIYTFSFLIMLLSLSCSNQENASKGISKVSVAFSGIGCDSRCPFEAISIDNELNLKYYGGRFSEKRGFFEGKITTAIWNSIQIRFNKFIEIGIDSPRIGRTDHPEVEFFVHDSFRKHRTRFQVYTGDMSFEDLEIIYWFKEIINSTNLDSCDSLKFETSLQYSEIPYKFENKK